MDTNKLQKPLVRSDLLLAQEVYDVVGASMDVFNELGAGFLEAVYQEALEAELRLRQIPFESQKPLRISYKGEFLRQTYCADLICFGQLLVELKAIKQLSSRDEAQVLNYLKATGLRVALLINFGDPGRLEWHRIVR